MKGYIYKKVRRCEAWLNPIRKCTTNPIYFNKNDH